MMRLPAVLWTLGLTAAVFATQRQTNSPQMSHDEKFIVGAMSGGNFEVQAGKLALERSTDPNVKKIAQKMIDDHTKANQELTKIVEHKKMTPNSKPADPVKTAMFQKLSSHEGKEFDECFIGMQVLTHEEAVMCFKREAKNGQDAELKEFATKTLPKLKEHLKMVRSACENSIERGTYETAMHGSEKE